jgi:hypothetical protein
MIYPCLLQDYAAAYMYLHPRVFQAVPPWSSQTLRNLGNAYSSSYTYTVQGDVMLLLTFKNQGYK